MLRPAVPEDPVLLPQPSGQGRWIPRLLTFSLFLFTVAATMTTAHHLRLFAPLVAKTMPTRAGAVLVRAEPTPGTGFDEKVRRLKEEARAKAASKKSGAPTEQEAAATPSTNTPSKITPRPLGSVVPNPAPAPPSGFFPDVPAVTKARYERLFLRAIAALFLTILGFGLLIGVSGFLPPEWDLFIQNTVFPIFSPLIGVFLVFSSAYGLFKSREDPNLKY